MEDSWHIIVCKRADSCRVLAECEQKVGRELAERGHSWQRIGWKRVDSWLKECRELAERGPIISREWAEIGQIVGREFLFSSLLVVIKYVDDFFPQGGWGWDEEDYFPQTGWGWDEKDYFPQTGLGWAEEDFLPQSGWWWDGRTSSTGRLRMHS